MEIFKIQIIETVVIIALFLLIKVVIAKTIGKAAVKYGYQKPRVTIIKKIINFLLLLIALGAILFIWGVDQSKLVYFISTMLTILGIAFFAQWSIISNITSSLIIFFNHPANIGDEISVLDKDYSIEGKINDIGIFFVIIKTAEGEKITIPSNIFTQKMIKRKGTDDHQI